MWLQQFKLGNTKLYKAYTIYLGAIHRAYFNFDSNPIFLANDLQISDIYISHFKHSLNITLRNFIFGYLDISTPSIFIFSKSGGKLLFLVLKTT